MLIKKKIRRLVLTMVLVVAVSTIGVACSNEESAKPSQFTPESVEPQKVIEDSIDITTPEEPGTTEFQSLEFIATKDGEQFLDALKKEDAQQLSLLMAHAENEITPDTMKIVIEAFQLQFDHLADLKLSFESNVQNEQYYIENFKITGVKNGETRFVPFQVMYYKSEPMSKLTDDDIREPLYDSPLINFPYMIRDAERYLQAIAQEDVESLLLHLGLYNPTEDTESTVRTMLNMYREQLDMATTKVIPVSYDENMNLFEFEYQDGKGRSHRIQVELDTWLVIDDWTSVITGEG